MYADDVLIFAARYFDCEAVYLSVESVCGGDINESYKVTNPNGDALFIKANTRSELLASECRSLEKISVLGLESYPDVKGFDQTSKGAMLALEHAELRALNDESAEAAALELYKQHQCESEKFGWYEDGYIGGSTQSNVWCDSWVDFFAQQRLRPQLSLAIQNGLAEHLLDRGESVMSELGNGNLIDDSEIKPRLLHGDLWHGNLGFDCKKNRAVFYDPAPYFGDPEADIAMTRQFGVLPNKFYQTYRQLQAAPKDEELRSSIYDLYHALNHFNLFGRSYESSISQLLNKIGCF